MKDLPTKTAIAAKSYEKGLDEIESTTKPLYNRSPSLHDLTGNSNNNNVMKATSSQPGDFTLPRRRNLIKTRAQSISSGGPKVSGSRVRELGSLGKSALQFFIIHFYCWYIFLGGVHI